MALLVAVLGLTGCAAERTLLVTSDPPGATVRLDEEVVGITPLTMPFEHYGVRRITLYKEGFHTHTVRCRFDPPFYGYFPLDILSEVFLPLGWRDRRILHATLLEGQDLTSHPSLSSVIERSALLRNAEETGITDLPDPKPAELPAYTEDPEEPGLPDPQQP